MSLYSALNLAPGDCLALVGAGGKTSAMALLARQAACPVILACSTHLGLWQTGIADRHIVIEAQSQLAQLTHLPAQVTLFTGPAVAENRLAGLPVEMLAILRELAKRASAILIIEADGSRQRPLKAPAAHEPVIPAWVDQVVVVAGLSGLGQPADEAHQVVFRPAVFAQLAGIAISSRVTAQDLARVLCHPLGGLKEIPARARRTVLLNQVDDPRLLAAVKGLARLLLIDYDQVVAASIQAGIIHTVYRHCAGFILVAGDSPRLVLPFVGYRVTRAARAAARNGGFR